MPVSPGASLRIGLLSAAAVILADEDYAERHGYHPIGRLVAYSHAGVEPRMMGIGPVPAVRKVPERADPKVDDIDVFEVNEAFAAQALAVAAELGLPPERTNPNGSGISLGHPLGATGAILVIKALYELRRTGGRYTLVTMCIGGGQGIAAVFERIQLDVAPVGVMRSPHPSRPRRSVEMSTQNRRGRPESPPRQCWVPRPTCSPQRMRQGWARRRWRCCGVPRGSLARRGAAVLRYWTSLTLAGPVAAARWPGVDAPPPVPVPAGDKRFADPAWTANPAFFAVRQAHLAASRLVADVLAAGAEDPVDDAKAALVAGFLLDAAAPTNFLLTNPAALKRAFETTGSARSPCSTRCWITANPGSWARSPTRRPWPVWNGRWRPRACWRAARWPVLSTCCAPTTSSSITSSPAG